MPGRAALLGTLVSALAVAAAWALHWAGGFPLLALATAAAALLGLRPGPWTSVALPAAAGQWLALWPLSLGLWWMGAAPGVFPWPGWVGGFLLYRFLAVVRPGPIGRLARRGGAAAALVAGLATALAMALSAALAHGALM